MSVLHPLLDPPCRGPQETLESVSLYTRFSDFSTISSFGFNHSSSELVGIFLEMLEIIPMFVLVVKDFARRRFVAQICANSGILELSQRTCLPILSLNS